jgi:hypothetical protein
MLIRRVSSHRGRPNVAARLKWIKANQKRVRLRKEHTEPLEGVDPYTTLRPTFEERWADFLALVGQVWGPDETRVLLRHRWVVIPGSVPTRYQDAPGRAGFIEGMEAILSRLPHDRAKDRLLPWLWREMHHYLILTWATQAQIQGLWAIIDWYSNPANNVDIMALTWPQAWRRQKEWHDSLEMLALQGDVSSTFPKVLASGDGWEWRKYRDEGGLRPVLSSIGAALGHCYKNEPYKTTYPRDFVLILLLTDVTDGEGVTTQQPKVMAAITKTSGTVREINGVQNRVPREEFWPAVFALLKRLKIPMDLWGRWRTRTPEWVDHVQALSDLATLQWEGPLSYEDAHLDASDIERFVAINNYDVPVSLRENYGLMQGHLSSIRLKRRLIHYKETWDTLRSLARNWMRSKEHMRAFVRAHPVKGSSDFNRPYPETRAVRKANRQQELAAGIWQALQTDDVLPCEGERERVPGLHSRNWPLTVETWNINKGILTFALHYEWPWQHVWDEAREVGRDYAAKRYEAKGLADAVQGEPEKPKLDYKAAWRSYQWTSKDTMAGFVRIFMVRTDDPQHFRFRVDLKRMFKERNSLAIWSDILGTVLAYENGFKREAEFSWGGHFMAGIAARRKPRAVKRRTS